MTPPRQDRMTVGDLVERIVGAHGGLERWRGVTSVDLRLSSGGLAFAAKGQPRALHDVVASVATAGQSVELRGPSPQPWHLRFGPTGTSGARALPDQLTALRRGRRRIRWSVDDVGAFAAAALWTYVQVPFVLTDTGVEVATLGSWSKEGENWLRLAITFPAHVATHCRRQVVYVDGDYRLRRHDYTALAFGRWARAAQYLSKYRHFDGLSFATRRRVYPRLPGGRPARFLPLVWIDLHEASVR
jgi:hypothetical protein